MDGYGVYGASEPSNEEEPQPIIVCLCGSTRFSQAYQKANLDETLAGKIVLTIGCDMRSDAALFEHLSDAEREDIKLKLDALHCRKIDLADEILVLNVGGYIGESTRREIAYAESTGTRIRFLEPFVGSDAPAVAHLLPCSGNEMCGWSALATARR